MKASKTFEFKITPKFLSRAKAGLANLANSFALQPVTAVA